MEAPEKRLEQYSRVDNVITHRLKTRHKVWSTQITPHNEGTPHEELFVCLS